MRTTLSARRSKFINFIGQASAQPTAWLERAYNDPNRYSTPLMQAAILRVLAGRYGSIAHLVFADRKAAAKAILAAQVRA